MYLSTALLTALALAVCSSANVVTMPPKAMTPQQAECPLTRSMPVCGVPCLASAASAVGCASPTDFACQCRNSGDVQDRAAGCVVAECGPETARIIQSVGNAICQQCAPEATSTA